MPICSVQHIHHRKAQFLFTQQSMFRADRPVASACLLPVQLTMIRSKEWDFVCINKGIQHRGDICTGLLIMVTGCKGVRVQGVG